MPKCCDDHDYTIRAGVQHTNRTTKVRERQDFDNPVKLVYRDGSFNRADESYDWGDFKARQAIREQNCLERQEG